MRISKGDHRTEWNLNMPEDVDFTTTREGETDSDEDFAGQSTRCTCKHYVRTVIIWDHVVCRRVLL